MTMKPERAAEVRFGEGVEDEILRRWALQSKQATGITRWLKSHPYAHFDFAGFNADFIPITYVEVKRRRSSWGQYGDVMFPMVKHDFARRLARSCIGLCGVTYYACGTVVEVDLADEPAEVKVVTRRDRPNEPCRHGFWKGAQLSVFLPGGWNRK